MDREPHNKFIVKVIVRFRSNLEQTRLNVPPMVPVNMSHIIMCATIVFVGRVAVVRVATVTVVRWSGGPVIRWTVVRWSGGPVDGGLPVDRETLLTRTSGTIDANHRDRHDGGKRASEDIASRGNK